MEQEPYNPLDKRNLGVSVADALLNRAVDQLPPTERFVGAGIYAIYYTGDFPEYAAIAKRNRDKNYSQPLYVGKAVPAGSRKGAHNINDSPGTVLYRRLVKHSESIAEAENLQLSDFACRWLVVDDIWIPLGESLLINKFSPVWNQALDGFGNHDPGKGRYGGQRPPWDVLHPGRPWAAKCRDNEKSFEEIVARVRTHIVVESGE